MLKIVVFDSGYGGEFLADRLEDELPILQIIRVIDWRHADLLQSNPKEARKLAKEALHPYIGKVDLIIFANYLLSLTSLKHFQRRYKNQKFIGLKLSAGSTVHKDSTIILTTKPVTRTINYYNYIFRLHRKVTAVTEDSWPAKIDDGELTEQEIYYALKDYILSDVRFQEIVLACSQFYDIKTNLTNLFGCNLKIHDGFDELIKETCKTLRIRGGVTTKAKD